MKILKAASAIFCLTATAMILSPVVKAQQTGDWNKKTKVTFSAPVEIPGVHLKGYSILPAGTYVFKLLGSQVNRHIVQIQNESESVTYATIMAIPNSRIKRTDETVITFRERPNGEPPALRAWFYPDATWGDEFVYPKSKAKDLAKANNTPVLYSNDESAAEVTEPIQTPTAPAMAEINAAPVAAYNATGDEVELSQAVDAPAPVQTADTTSTTETQIAQNTPPPAPPAFTAPAPVTTASELPQTGSSLGLYLVSGLLALGAAFSVRSLRQRYQ